MLLNQFCTFPDKCLNLSDRYSLPAEIYLEQDPKTPFYYWKRLPVYKILQVDSECQPVTIQKFVLFFY